MQGNPEVSVKVASLSFLPEDLQNRFDLNVGEFPLLGTQTFQRRDAERDAGFNSAKSAIHIFKRFPLIRLQLLMRKNMFDLEIQRN